MNKINFIMYNASGKIESRALTPELHEYLMIIRLYIYNNIYEHIHILYLHVRLFDHPQTIITRMMIKKFTACGNIPTMRLNK